MNQYNPSQISFSLRYNINVVINVVFFSWENPLKKMLIISQFLRSASVTTTFRACAAGTKAPVKTTRMSA